MSGIKGFLDDLAFVFGISAEGDAKPDKIIEYQARNDRQGVHHVHIITPDDVREHLEQEHGITLENREDYKKIEYKELVENFVRTKISGIDALNFLDRISMDKDVLNTLYTDNASNTPGASKDSRVRSLKTSVAVYPDTQRDSLDIISQGLGVDGVQIKTDHGVDDEIIESLIRHHEDGHGLGLNEFESDRYATLAVLRESGVTDSVVSTLQYWADFRLAMNPTSLYSLCGIAVTHELSNLKDFTNEIFVTGRDRNEDYDPLKTPYRRPFEIVQTAPHFYEKKLWHNISPEEKADKTAEGRANIFDKQRENIWAARDELMAAPDSSSKMPKMEMYEHVLSAIDRLETLLVNTPGESAYEEMTPVSDMFGKEFPGPAENYAQNRDGTHNERASLNIPNNPT